MFLRLENYKVYLLTTLSLLGFRSMNGAPNIGGLFRHLYGSLIDVDEFFTARRHQSDS
jgi:hypothetical protein